MDQRVGRPRFGVRLAAACSVLLALAAVGREACPSVETAQAALASGDAAARAAAAKELRGAFPEGALGVPVLVAALEDDAPEVREAAAAALERLARAAPAYLARFLADAKDPQRAELLRGLDTISELGAKVSVLDLSRVGGPKARAVALVILGRLQIGPRDSADVRHVVPFLLTSELRAVAGRDEAAVGPIAAALALHGHDFLPGVRALDGPPEVLALLEAPEPSVRWMALGILQLLRAKDEPTRAAAGKLVSSVHPGVAGAARALVGQAAPGVRASESLETLVERLPLSAPRHEPLADSAVSAIEALGRMGSGARAAQERLATLLAGVLRNPVALEYDNDLVLAEALCRIDRPSGQLVGILAAELKTAVTAEQPDLDRLIRATRALTGLVGSMPSAKMRTQVAERVALAAPRFGLVGYPGGELMALLEALGADAAPAIPRLLEGLQQVAVAAGESRDPFDLLMEEGARYEARVAAPHRTLRLLARMGPAARDARSALTATKATDPLVRYEAALALRRIGP